MNDGIVAIVTPYPRTSAQFQFNFNSLIGQDLYEEKYTQTCFVCKNNLYENVYQTINCEEPLFFCFSCWETGKSSLPPSYCYLYNPRNETSPILHKFYQPITAFCNNRNDKLVFKLSPSLDFDQEEFFAPHRAELLKFLSSSSNTEKELLLIAQFLEGQYQEVSHFIDKGVDNLLSSTDEKYAIFKNYSREEIQFKIRTVILYNDEVRGYYKDFAHRPIIKYDWNFAHKIRKYKNLLVNCILDEIFYDLVVSLPFSNVEDTAKITIYVDRPKRDNDNQLLDGSFYLIDYIIIILLLLIL